MPTKKRLQVFVSSTYSDLKEERQAAVMAILTAGHIPAGMELFAAGDQSQLEVIKRWIDESDVYLLILGGRYGSIEPTTGKGYTQIEFEYAIEKRKPLFSVVINEDYLEQKIKQRGSEVMEKDNPNLLRVFRKEVLTKMVRFFEDPKDIKLAIHETMAEFARREDLKGWISGNEAVNTGEISEQIARLTKENSELRNKLLLADINEEKYAGLTYDEMMALLQRENLLPVLVDNFQELLKGLRVNYQDQKKFELYEPLHLLRIVTVEKLFAGTKYVKVTTDGHRFYLRYIANQIVLPSKN